MEQAREAAQAVTEFFQGNPFGTVVGQQIEQATDASLASENWALNMEICDMINNSEEGPRDAVRAIRKRLQTTMGKNNQAAMYTLTVLETCVKNCDHRLHQLVAQKEFAQEMVKLIGPKYDPAQVVQEKVLSLIQAWAHAFRDIPDLRGVSEVYDDLKTKGIEFPVLDPNSAPIFVSGGVVRPAAMIPTPPTVAGGIVPPPATAAPITPINLSAEQLAKLRSELDIVSTNLKVLRELLTELAPGQEEAEDLQLLQDLNAACRQMQSRLLELLERVSNEEVTSELLLMNDELNNVFAKYDRYMANRSKDQSQRAQGKESGALIDLGGGDNQSGNNLAGQMSKMNVSGASSAVGGQSQQAGGPGGVKESDVKEMEDWLKKSGEGGAGAGTGSGTGQGQGTEFDQFLTHRAEATSAPGTTPAGQDPK